MSRGEYEALYGGAAGGGKSDALVIEALRQIDKPYYKALILRKTFPELRDIDLNYLANSLRSTGWGQMEIDTITRTLQRCGLERM